MLEDYYNLVCENILEVKLCGGYKIRIGEKRRAPLFFYFGNIKRKM
jgi:hypothetical protein